MKLFLFLLSVYGISTYELKCPVESQRHFRLHKVCNEKSPEHYSCLLDQHSNTYEESCKEPADYVRPGKKYVIGVFRKNTDCDIWRYQPFKFWSNRLSQCVFFKSRCNEVGQSMPGFESASDDKVCQCDHNQGYAFINNTKDHCFCKPSEEDCTCYKKKCPSNYILTSDYKCMPEFTASSICNNVTQVLDVTKNNNQSVDIADLKYSNITKVAKSSKIMLFVLLIIVLVSFISVLCMLVFAEIQIIDEYKNVTNSPPTSNDTTEDQTKLSSEEINEKMCLVHREKIQETAKDTDNKLFTEKRKRYDDREVKVSYIRTRYSDNCSNIKGSDVYVALEIGLTYSGIAVCLWGSRQETKIYLLTWVSNDQGTINSKISTSILFRPDKSVDSIGNDAESNHCGGNHNNLAGWSYFKHFMLSLCDEQEKESEDMQICDVQKKCRMTAVDVISSFIKNMKQKLLIDLVKSDISCNNTDIQWVLTVPAIWNKKSKQIMSQAAEMSGLSRDEFILLEEPEAVLKYYSTYDKKLPASYRCIVLHVGDNAINSTVMKVKDDTYTIKSTVFSQYGGVTQEVFKLLNDLFSEKVTNYCEENHPREYMTLFNNIEKKMKHVQSNTDVKIRVPRVCLEVIKKSHLHQDVSFVGDKMKIEYKLFKDYYNNFIKCRLQVVENFLAKESVAGIGVLFLAGDFIENVFVEALRGQYPEHIICVASDPNEVILRGALL